MIPFTDERLRMVNLIAARGVRDTRVLDAMRSVPREEFLSADLQGYAYEDGPLPIECDQTISQPYVVAWMIEVLQLPPGARVLEVGAGSGYAAAVLSRVAEEVYAIERHTDLARSADETLKRLGYDNIQVRHGDGTQGWPEHAPYDGISVAAGGPSIPRPLLDQLAVGGRMVIPVGPDVSDQQLTRVTRRSSSDYEYEDLGGVRFVPLIGEAGE